MSTIDWKSSNIFKVLSRQVKDYNPAYVLKDVCIADQAAPAGAVANDCYYFMGSVTSTVFGVVGVTVGAFMVYGTGWTPLIMASTEMVKKTVFDSHIKQTPGTSLTDVMSQKAATDNSENVITEKGIIKIGDGSFYIADANGSVIVKVDFEGIKTKSYNICNSNGNIVAVLDADLILGLILNKTVLDYISGDARYIDAFYITDNLNNVVIKYDANGLDVAKISTHFLSLLNSGGSATTLKNGIYLADVNMCIVYGQSLAVGGATIGAEDFYTAKMFANGVILSVPDDADINSESYNEAHFGVIDQMSMYGDGLNGRMLTKKWNELIVQENGKNLTEFNHYLMGNVAGVSGGQWYQLNKQYISIDGNGYATLTSFEANSVGRAYCNLLHGVYFANKSASAQGKSFNVPVLCWVQGEASSDCNDTVSQYYTKLQTIFTDLNNDIKLITGQTNDVQFIIYQNSSFPLVAGYNEGVPLACLKAALEMTNVSFGSPLYPFSPPIAASDKVHLGNVGYALMASHFGIQAKRVITDGIEMIPLYPKTFKQFASGLNYYLEIEFDVPVTPLVFDISGDDGYNMLGHGTQPNYGFSILNSTVEIITDVRLSCENKIVITCNQDPTGFEITYALTGVNGGGNLRDSQGNTITTEFNGITYRCDNWCPFFRITI